VPLADRDPVKDDRVKLRYFAGETFYLDLFGNSGNALLTKKRGIGTIRNDD
jgi:hypothetical protein